MTSPTESASKRFCTACGNPLPESALFCTGCGSSAEPPPSSPPTDPATGAEPVVFPVADVPTAARPPESVHPQPTSEFGVTTSPPGPPPSSRSRAPWVIGGVIGALILVLGVVALVALTSEDEATLSQSEIDAIVDREFAGESAGYRNCALAEAGTLLASAGSETEVLAVLRNSSSSPECRVLAEGDGDEDVAAAPPTSGPSSTSSPSTTTRGLSDRGLLYGNEASLRTRPFASDDTFIRSVGNEAKDIPITIHGVQDDGWYEISIQGDRGWVFGTFIQPSADGFEVAETRSGERATLRDSSGRPTGEPNPSLNAVLVVDRSGPYWEIVLPDGRPAWAEPAELDLIG